ncbi:PD-(D/E)XK nuclease family protein [Gaetbulibacter aestuarii]|uniref:PD-(D/E)XK nuclease family protein n=1 Tax=Gaetbulibacter aestuarii TaxID=1502358 RepID=A0ABW7MVG1_9FLAO
MGTNTFLFDVLKDLQDQDVNLSEITFILPSKRAGLFLKHEIAASTTKTLFSPEILSIEEFVEQLSGLHSKSNTTLLFEFYSVYESLTDKKHLDSFEAFSKWAQILLQDFNEIDRYVIPQEQIFDYLSAIQDLKHWSLDPNKTDFVKNYLAFWNKLHKYYEAFVKALKGKNIGYQGLLYREALKHLKKYMDQNSGKQHVFLGFNALNTAEQDIIQVLLAQNMARIYWDIDTAFLEHPNHDAALFIKGYQSNWSYFKKHPFQWSHNHYSNQKDIQIYGIPKNIGQAKHIGALLQELQKTNPKLEKTAVVLGDENLLIPVLNSLPKNLTALNITMGFPLSSIPLAHLFELLFKIHKQNSERFYYQDIHALLTHQFVRPLFYIDETDYASLIIEAIHGNNITYLSAKRLKSIAPEASEIISVLLSGWQNAVKNALDRCFELIQLIKHHFDTSKEKALLSLEYLYRFNTLFNELAHLNKSFNHIKDIKTLHSVFKELLSTETLDFQGEPLEGLQIMGMLESRVLDFDTVIIASVNEGILPAGKSNNSFIPFDVKLENKLPTYKEKDAVYTYHFYHLLQRARHIHILYNTEADVLTGGEKSRFITQLEFDETHQIKEHLVMPPVPVTKRKLNEIVKTPGVLEELKRVGQKGFSPSSLTNYIRNPIDFYYQKVLHVNEFDMVEEHIAANTLGTVVHNTLEDFYRPLKGSFLTEDLLKNLKSKIETQVVFHFNEIYKEGDLSRGKNLIIFEIAKRYVSNFLNAELKEIKAGNTIKIIDVEADASTILKNLDLPFEVTMKGKVDRIDECNGLTRIIDYKTGAVNQNEVDVVNWEDMPTDYKKYSKSFQVLSYAYMLAESNRINLPVEAGIISFKNLSSGFLKFGKKESQYGRKKDHLITAETLSDFAEVLKQLILEIYNPDIPFTEKEV